MKKVVKSAISNVFLFYINTSIYDTLTVGITVDDNAILHFFQLFQGTLFGIPHQNRISSYILAATSR